MSATTPPGTSGFGTGTSRMALLKLRVSGQVKQGLYSRSTRLGLRRDLTLALQPPNAKIQISVRPAGAGDFEVLLPHVPNAHPEALEIMWRRSFLRKAPSGCFVAVDLRDGSPCYMQWLFGPTQNDRVSAIGGFPKLGPDEALLENAYTPPSHRGMGVMSAAMALIAELAAPMGARYVLTFVGMGNTASLKGCQRAGFSPHLVQDRWQLGFGLLTGDRFTVLADDDERRTARF